jgi:hypothetical protein
MVAAALTTTSHGGSIGRRVVRASAASVPTQAV